MSYSPSVELLIYVCFVKALDYITYCNAATVLFCQQPCSRWSVLLLLQVTVAARRRARRERAATNDRAAASSNKHAHVRPLRVCMFVYFYCSAPTCTCGLAVYVYSKRMSCINFISVQKLFCVCFSCLYVTCRRMFYKFVC